MRESNSRAHLGAGGYASRAFAALLASAVLGMVCVATSDAAQAWRIDSLAASTALPGSTLRYVVEARNIGDTPTDGSTTTLSASLPPGITAVSAEVIHSSAFPYSCTADDGVSSIVGQSRIICIAAQPLNVQKSDVLRLTTAVDRATTPGTQTAVFRMSGGGAPGASVVDSTLIGPPPGFGVEAFDGIATGSPAGDLSTQAGGHPYAITTSIDFTSVDNVEPLIDGPYPLEAVKNVVVDLPPGLVGDPTGAATCALSQLGNSEGTNARPLCPPASQVGTTVIRFANVAGNSIFGPMPVFNITPPPDVPARFGFNALGTIVVLDAEVRSGGDYGLTVAARNAPEAIGLTGTTVTFWGVPADPSHDLDRACPGRGAPFSSGRFCTSGAPLTAFLRNPTSCPNPGVGLPFGLRADSWIHPGVFKEASFRTHDPLGYPLLPSLWGAQHGPDGCARVPFDPALVGGPSGPAKVASPAGFSFDLSLPQSDVPSSIGQSDLRKAVVTLPEGVRVSPSAAHGLAACSPEQIGLHDNSDPLCPDASRVGSVTIDTPLLPDPLKGSVYLATPRRNPFDGALLAVYVTAHGPGTWVKLAGHVTPDSVTGQLTTIFDDNPQLPFSRLHLEFNDGPTAPLVTPRKCGTYTTTGEFTGWSGKIVPTVSRFDVSGSGPSAACPIAHQFNPVFAAKTLNPVAGQQSTFYLSLGRSDVDEELAGVSVDMPNGLTGKIASVPLCSERDARAGSCAESARIGRVTVGAGAGPNPFYIDSGRAYLTGPYKGAPYGLAIVVPAVAGPFDLGNVVVRSAIFVDKHTAELRVVSDRLPRILEGIPLDVRDVRVAVDRKDFIVNPTSCAKKTIRGVLTSTEGTTANVSSRFQVGDCASLPFRPRFDLSVGSAGHTARNATVPLSTTLSMPSRSANLRYVRVTLPQVINARLTVINRACTRAVYEARRCEAARAGTAVARTPLLREPLSGNVYFVKNGHPLPDLFIALRGEVDFDLIGRISIPGSTRLATTFDAIPDVPVKSFTLKLFSGPKGTVGAATNLCTRRARNATAELDFIGQNGRVRRLDQRLNIRGCNTPHRHRSRRGRR